MGQQVPQLVHGTPLDRRRRPRPFDGGAQPLAAVDDAELGGAHAPGRQVLADRRPGVGALAPAERQMHQDLLATPLHPQDGQHRDRAHAPAQPHPQVKAIQVEGDEIEIGQRPRPPGLELGLQPLDDPADRALRQGPALQQRLQGAADPARVRPAQVGLQHGLVDLAHPPGVGRQDLALPFGGGAGPGLQAGPGHGQRHGAHRAGDRAHLRPVAIAQPGFAPRVRGPEHRGELRAHEMLNGLSHHGPHLGLQGRGPIDVGRLVPGRLLWQRRHWRISSRCAPPRASRLVVSNPPRRYAISLFHNYRDLWKPPSRTQSRRRDGCLPATGLS